MVDFEEKRAELNRQAQENADMVMRWYRPKIEEAERWQDAARLCSLQTQVQADTQRLNAHIEHQLALLPPPPLVLQGERVL